MLLALANSNVDCCCIRLANAPSRAIDTANGIAKEYVTANVKYDGHVDSFAL